MEATTELRRTLSRRLLPLLSDLEDLVYRHGYLRVVAGAVAALSTIGILGQVLGLAWLRTTFATAAAVLFVTAALVSFSATRNLRDRLTRTEQLLHSYLPDLPKTTPVGIRRWEQDTWIDENGDTWIRREVTMAKSAGHHLRYLTFTSVCYGATKYTNREKRRVTYDFVHATASDPQSGIRVPTTSRWSDTELGEPKLTVYVHLGRTVEEGDMVTAEWHWPKYSADLMKGLRPEAFDTSFTTTVAEFEFKVTFRNFKDDAALKVKPLPTTEIERSREGRDTVLRLKGTAPQNGQRFGFVADVRGTE
ncbi:hypothetical protein DMH03_35640 [Amycolatopsis sp. WAC 01376]|uniref:hypothetical protein n=1 Tax=Amycolatopsis sp. WAC 01376 TaxID=2203195 RepID=UPI000F7B9EC3|nr:hypothetical protein [Amycolatopsis sp. WAC 01376]RSM54178.1 hypothetical protein DMH03_35640 [Amycolatopsis sp. WAC 01376]